MNRTSFVTPQTQIDVIDLAMERLERGWCKNAMAIDDEGFEVRMGNPKACSWCMVGAVRSEMW